MISFKWRTASFLLIKKKEIIGLSSGNVFLAAAGLMTVTLRLILVEEVLGGD